MGKRYLLLTGLLATFVANSMAMSLGASRGTATIGRPLDMSVPAALAADDRGADLADLCIEVDLAYGDRRIQRSRVQVSVDKPAAGAAQNLMIRIRAPELIDEPFVTLNLQMGCQQKLQRQYVMLADLEPEPVRLAALPAPSFTSAPPVSAPVPPVVAATAVPLLALQPLESSAGESSSLQRFRNGTPQVASPVPTTAQPSERSAPDARAVQAPPEPRRVADAPAAAAPQRRTPRKPAEVKTAPAKPAEVKVATPPRARLSLAPLSALAPAAPASPGPGASNAAPAVEPQDRDAALWNALNAEKAERLQDAEKLKGLEASVLALQAQALRDRQSLQVLEQQLGQARLERSVFAGLSILVLLALGYALWRNNRTHSAPWWRSESLPPADAPNSLDQRDAATPDSSAGDDLLIEDPEPQAQALHWPAKPAAGGVTSATAAAAPGALPVAALPVAASLKPAPAFMNAQQPGPIAQAAPITSITSIEPAIPAASRTTDREEIDIEFDLPPPKTSAAPMLAWTHEPSAGASAHSSAGRQAELADPALKLTTPENTGPSVAEELFDVRQKADFFVSLGRHEHAAEALRSYLSPDGQPNPRGYIELFELYHGLDRADDYEALRKTFKIQFDADVLPFALYDSHALAEQIGRVSETVRPLAAPGNEPSLPEEGLDPGAAEQSPPDSGFALLDFDLEPLPENKVSKAENAVPPPPAKVDPKPTDDSFFAKSDARWN
jgi:hypothetical protein